MLGNKYRIKEIIFADGHREYIAQDAVKFFWCNTLVERPCKQCCKLLWM